MKIQFSYRERMAGLFLLFGALGVIVFTIGAALQNRWLEPRISFHTHIIRGDGLREGSPVLLSGIDVGEVGEMKILPDNRIDMEILIRERHVNRMRVGVRCEIKRLLGIGEKRVHLISEEGTGPNLPPGALVPANEPMDLLDAVSTIDLNHYIKTMDRAVAALEVTLGKLEEESRLERMMDAFDELGPTMQRMNRFLDDVDDPLIAILQDPNLKKTFKGAERLFNDPQTRKAMRAVAKTFAPEKIDSLLQRTDKLIARLNVLLAKDGSLVSAMDGLDKLTHDKRVDRMLTAMDSISDGEKLERLFNNMSALTHEMAKLGPQLPELSRELLATLREMVVVFKALQKTWLLDDETKEALKELKNRR